MTSITRLVLATFVTSALAGCVEEGKYPLTGKECAPDDPVLSMDAGDCSAAPAGNVSGGF